MKLARNVCRVVIKKTPLLLMELVTGERRSTVSAASSISVQGVLVQVRMGWKA